MIAVVAPIAALLLSAALLLMGNGLQGTLLPVRASIESFSAIDIGVLGSAYFVGFAFGCVAGTRMVRRAGHIRTFTAMVAIASSAVLAHAIFVDPVIWWVLRAATGMCLAVLYLVIESWLNEMASNDNRGLVFSIYTVINLTVVTVGQMMLVLDEPTAFSLFAVASILLSLAAVPVAMTTAPVPGPVANVDIRLIRLYRISPVGMVACFAVGLANGSFWGLGPVYAQGDGGDVSSVAIFMSVTVIAGALGQWPLGRLSDRIDRRRVMLISCAGSVVAAAGLALLGFGSLKFVFAFLFGLFAFPLYSLSVAHTNDHVEPSDYVEAASALLMVYALGAVVGPLAASLLMSLIGGSGLFAFTLLVHLGAAAFIVYRLRRRPAPPQESHISFGDALRVSSTVSTVDPTAYIATERPPSPPPESENPRPAGPPGANPPGADS